ncbi:MAG: branched-chain amino acid aminotransferase [Actinomycetota bacterium]
MSQTSSPPSSLPAFGTAFGETMSVARWAGGEWSPPGLQAVAPLPFHPASHVLHYGSSCFEGLKAHRGADGVVRAFRLDRHVARLRASADRMCLPVPPFDLAEQMIVETVGANLDAVPDSPGSLYLRPTLVGTEPNVGAAGSPTSEALLFVLSSPVGDYFAGGISPLRIAVETKRPRTTPQFGSVKTGANYAMALSVTMEARSRFDVDQVMFAPDGVLQETGASNVMLVEEGRIVTPALDGSFLEGITRDSLLTLAADEGMEVDERRVTIDEVLEWCRRGEIALSGTAAVLAPVGTLVVDGETVPVGDGASAPVTLRLREMLVATQTGRRPDRHGWTRPVG